MSESSASSDKTTSSMDNISFNAFENARLTPKLYHPATFLERGVALPLTTPLLVGARVRPLDNQRLELILLNPSGGRGVYILPWTGIGAFCRPTMHDSIFNQRVAALSFVTPPIIRQVARQLATEGLAGEDALEAAKAAIEADRGDLVVANYQLLMLLFQQVNQNGGSLGDQGLAHGARSENRFRSAVDLVSTQLGRSGQWTATALEELAELMMGLELGEKGAKPRIQHQVEALQQTRDEIQQWSAARSDESLKECGAMFQSAAGLTLGFAQVAIAEARKLTADMVELLRRWGGEPEKIRSLVGRPDWLLDGWERICAIWRNAKSPQAQDFAVAEIAGLVPVMPKEASEWAGVGSKMIEREVARHSRIVPFKTDWLTGQSVFDMVARNEQLSATTC